MGEERGVKGGRLEPRRGEEMERTGRGEEKREESGGKELSPVPMGVGGPRALQNRCTPPPSLVT